MISIKNLLEATEGKNINGNMDIIFKNFTIDSRTIEKNDFFVPIIGEKVDSHKYILECVNNGIIGYFINNDCSYKEEIIKESLIINKNICIIEVQNSEEALYKAAIYNREKHLEIPVVAITGSVGKTSTREMIASVLKQEKKLLVTTKNYNSCIGISLMLLKMDNQDICILEAGIDRFGEMEQESKMLKPDIAIITNIGTAHIGIFKNKENTFKEKIQITNYIKGIKKLILNNKDEILKNVKSNDIYDVLKYDMNLVKNIVKTETYIEFTTNIYDKEYKIKINEIGNHNIYNALCGIKVGELFNIKVENIIKGIENYKNFSRRLEKKMLKNNILIIDDTYNASIDSMKSGLETVNGFSGNRKIAVLGDMFDLGEQSDEIHLNLGKEFSKFDYEYLFTLGDASKNIAKSAFKYVKHIKSFDKKEDLIKELLEKVESKDIIYFKASNGMKFNELILDIEKAL